MIYQNLFEHQAGHDIHSVVGIQKLQERYHETVHIRHNGMKIITQQIHEVILIYPIVPYVMMDEYLLLTQYLENI